MIRIPPRLEPRLDFSGGKGVSSCRRIGKGDTPRFGIVPDGRLVSLGRKYYPFAVLSGPVRTEGEIARATGESYLVALCR